jgi:hypothetical protein
MMSFLYVWQTIIQAPLVAASAAIGFSQYLGYLVKLGPAEQKIVSAAVIVLVTILLYRKIDSIGKIAVLLWTGVILTMGWIIVGGLGMATVATLFITPVAYLLLAGLARPRMAETQLLEAELRGAARADRLVESEPT